MSALLNILDTVIEREFKELHAEGVRICLIGRIEAMPQNTRKKVERAIELTRNNDRLILNVAWNYGGRDEILYAIQKIIESGVTADQVTDELVNQNLFTFPSPDPDLIIRTSGEMRLSNFLIWQSAYSEWYSTPVFWPDFNKEEYKKAIDAYGLRKRRFGKL